MTRKLFIILQGPIHKWATRPKSAFPSFSFLGNGAADRMCSSSIRISTEQKFNCKKSPTEIAYSRDILIENRLENWIWREDIQNVYSDCLQNNHSECVGNSLNKPAPSC